LKSAGAWITIRVIIVTFSEPPKHRDRRTARFAAGERVREFQAFRQQAERRLDILEAATSRNDLVRLSSHRFEALGGNRKGQFSIRINQRRDQAHRSTAASGAADGRTHRLKSMSRSNSPIGTRTRPYWTFW
jgi:proteic killer suppression protein